FYQAWTNGELKKETLQNYAVQYKPFVDAFPRLVSRIHSQCEDPADRRQLILNLIEEEGFPKGTDHPTLWKNFATGLGVVADDFEAGPFSKDSMTLVNEFWD